MGYKDIYEIWLKKTSQNKTLNLELESIKDNDKEIEYRFYKSLEFGTAGMRGIIGCGTNMMNEYTVKRATKGLATYISSLGEKAKKKGVVISYDTRRYSQVFAQKTAGVLISHGIKVYMFNEPSPVPMLSYAVRQFKTIAGVMITASHNPKEYNGYKVYGEDGAQMAPELTEKVVEYIEKVDDYFDIEEIEINSVKNNKLLKIISTKFEKKYINELTKLSLSKTAIKCCGKNLKIVYTPLHGTGYRLVTGLLNKLGINCNVVKEQAVYDSEFSTVKVPNPENVEAMSLGVKLANEINADVVFGTDPDSDRLGVAIRNDKNEFINLTGNQVGVLLTNYILTRLREDNKLSNNAMVVKSFVSTGMVNIICKDYNVKLVETPVGFKFIGEKIKQCEEDKKHEFVFGFEESCGYLRGTHARDKDAVVASMLFSEMVCYYEYKKTTVYNTLMELYKKYGYTIDKTISIAYQGVNAMQDMNNVVSSVREQKIESVAGVKIVAVRDYLKGVTYKGEIEEKLEFSNINCMYYELENGGFICLRPSGTEPKLKVYFSVKGDNETQALNLLNLIIEEFTKILNK